MAPSFGRSISFPLSPSKQQQQARSRMAGGYHARSVSLPCRSHPILAHLHTHIRAVRAWAHESPATSPSSSGLAHLDALHAALADLLHLPEAQAALSAAASTTDRLLDAFLRLADAHGSFQESLLDLKRDVADALAAVRRRDASRLASALRSHRRAAKDMARLAAAAKDCKPSSRLGSSSAAEVEVAGLLAEAAAATASASAALFNTVAAMSASASAAACTCKRTAALVCLVSKKVAAEEEKEIMGLMERLEELEECIDDLETGTDKVFRSLVQTRVALLNVHTNIF
ncbi:hypothetical protein HU200_043369 [Digitaria exilis]|uniref:Uncharacterized protein n=1 Tax=Digitaria exilis TaxID=1010633 RepID=A0A835EHI7_9POAL|nr:hypothetical protein HU200_043369 [Digitaria exilis]CAB3471487.1 unnamed protein product [Digitaria exilis]